MSKQTLEVINNVGVLVLTTETWLLALTTDPAYSVVTSTSLSITIEAGATLTSVLQGNTVESYKSEFSYTASSPCCSSCTLWGGDVSVYYWPPAATTPLPATSTMANATTLHAASAVSTLVNEAGFTL